jgi:serine/threonine protein kinase
VTSEDLFGDMVDAPLPETARAPGPDREAPIKVKVSEPGAAVAAEGEKPALPAEMAALLDAFGPKAGGDASPAPSGEIREPFPAAPPPPAPVPPDHLALDLAAVAEQAFAETPPHGTPVARTASREPHWRDAVYGPYELLERVAVGGMAEVFKAKRTGVEGFEKIVAVKRILHHLSDNQEFVDMFVDEAKIVAGLTHPNIVQIFDLGRLESSYYIAMEYVHGRDLRTILRRAKDRGLKMPLDLALRVASLVAAALEYAHRKKDDRGRPMEIVHRDVSPQNILISFEGEVKLTDFGIAKAASKASTTDRGALRGKLLYMSPEQAWGRAMDRRSDLFSLGLVLYETITDQKPFLGTSAGSEVSILEAVRQCRIVPPREVSPRIPEELDRLVMKALARDPEDRFQDAAEMARGLERVLRDRPSPTAHEMTRFLEILFDREERGAALHEDHGLDGSSSGTGPGRPLELDTEEPAEEEPALPILPDLPVDVLLKRFGIK